MRKRVMALALLLALLALSGCGEAPVEAPELLEPVGVQSDKATAIVGELYRLDLYDGAVRPYVEELSFEVEGRVSRVLFYPGMEVQAGDALVQLDLSAEEKRAEALRRELEFLDQDYAYADELAEIDIDIRSIELEQLRAQGADSAQIAAAEVEIEQLRARARQAQQLREPELEAKRQELEALERKLELGVLRAPFSGRVAYCDMALTEGYWAHAYTPLVFLADDARLSLQCAYIPELTVRGTSRLYARIGAVDYEVEYVEVPHEEYVAAALSGATLYTTFNVTGPEEALDLLAPGQYAAIHLVRTFAKDAVLVPNGAVMLETGGRYVYVDENGERVRRPVKVGLSTDIMVQITEGLEEGEVVYVKD